ncbi:MAG: hypothetical protein JW832_18070, partial [Deltaproteobacteria bacterium]|nr:hypothetical protein [Deltaproteobacteria bacterium]
ICIFLYYGPTGYSGDGAFQYAQLLSIMQDFDLNLKNNFHPEASHLIGGINWFSFGPAILWSPFYVLGLLIKTVFLNNEGHSYIYFIPFSNLGTILYAYLGLKLTSKAFREYFKIEKNFFIELFTLFCTPLLFYVFREPQMSHTLGFFWISLLVYEWVKTYHQKITQKDLFLIALTIGFAGSIRFQSIVCGIIFIPQFVAILKNGTQYNFLKKIKIGFLSCLNCVSGILFGVLPQLIAWKMQFDSFFAFPHIPVFYFKPNFHEVWFGAHGLFVWHPFLAICVIGLLLMLIKKETRSTSTLFLLVLLLQSYICAIPTDPGASCAFGMRRLTEYLAMLAFGFGPFFTAGKTKVRHLMNNVFWFLCLFFGCINLCYFTIIGWPYGTPSLLCSQKPAFFEWILLVLWNADQILQKTFLPAIFTIDPIIQKTFWSTCGSIKIQILFFLAVMIPIANSLFFKEGAVSFLFKICCEKPRPFLGRKKYAGESKRQCESDTF